MIWTIIFSAYAWAVQPVPFPVFLKQGFSTVLEFESAPKRIVIGDSQNFQVERMEKSLVVRALAPYATGNLFVFFEAGEPRVFLLTASEEAEPTLYRKFEEVKPDALQPSPSQKGGAPSYTRGLVIRSASFDAKKDFLTVEAAILANGARSIHPAWEKARLRYKSFSIAPSRLWAERKEIQKDSKVKARFIFVKPNIPRNLLGVSLIVPLQGEQNALSVDLRRK